MQRRQFNSDQAIVNTMNQFKPQAVSGIDWANALENYNDAYNKAQDKQKQQDLADALIGGDEKQILAARAAYDPSGTVNYLDQQQRQQQARDWALADAERNHQWDMDKLERMNNNALGLAKAKAMLENNQMYGGSVADLAAATGLPLTGIRKYDEALLAQAGKDTAAAIKGEQATKVMSPVVSEALDRAEKGVDSGSGLGWFGAALEKAGWNPSKNSGENYANIETANSQMNALLRQKLQATGLTGSELNAAMEANAYRYTISPFDNETRIKQKIANFRKDYMGQEQMPEQSGKLENGVTWRVKK